MENCKYKRVLQELKSSNYGNITLVQEISKEDQLLQQEMVDVKASFILQEKKRLYLENLSKDKSTWCTVEEADKEFKQWQTARKEVKDKLEEEKERLNTILQKVQEEYDLLQHKIPKLEEKLKIFETKKGLFETKWKVNPKEAEASIEKCQQAVDKLETEIGKQKVKLKNLQGQIHDIRSELDHRNKNEGGQTGKKLITRMKKVMDFLETVSDVKVLVLGPEQIKVTFVTESSDSILSDVQTLNLEMTLTFNTCLETRLADVKINVDHFSINDIIDTAIALNDVPYLIVAADERWNQHYPLLTEMDVLTKHHAIDWIPEKGQLRVLVSKCGNIMFSLGVPKDYPASRDITLLDSYGISEVDVNNLPEKGSTLLQWVLYLEDKYGNL